MANKKIAGIVVGAVAAIAGGISVLSDSHQTYRTDVFDFSKYNWYYAGVDEDFMAKHNLEPGDTVAITDDVDSLNNINLGNASLHDLVFVNARTNKKPVKIGYFVLGKNAYNIKFLGNGSPSVEYGFKFFDKTHFGLSWECTGDMEVSHLQFDSCLIGINLSTKPGVTYPVQSQDLHAHHIKMRQISNESFYLGYVKDVSILMNLNLHDIEIDSSGWDGIQTRNTNSVRINNVKMNGIGLRNHAGDQHAILLYNCKDSGIVRNVTTRNIKGIGIFNSGFGDFLFENNDIEADGQSIYNRAYNTTDAGNADILNIGYQNTVMKCNRFRSLVKGVTVQYLTDTSLHKKVTLTATNNNCEGVFNRTKDVIVVLTNNSLTATCLTIPQPTPEPIPQPTTKDTVFTGRKGYWVLEGHRVYYRVYLIRPDSIYQIKTGDYKWYKLP